MTTHPDRPISPCFDLPGLDNPRLLPVLPFIYLAWADGELQPDEIAAVRERAAELDWLTESCRGELAQWLDPSHPPSPADFNRLRRAIAEAARELPDEARRSLTDLGAELARARAQESESWHSDSGRATFLELEAALGCVGPEAVREVLPSAARLTGAPPEVERGVARAAPRFDVGAMTRLLDGERHAIRQSVRGLLREPTFRHSYGLGTAAKRARVLAWCRHVAEHGLGALSYPEYAGGSDDLGAFIAAFETLAFFDQGLVVKYGVQFGLFGGSILQLGTEHHHRRYLADVGTMALPGCFAMTETGHGSNVRDLETTAVYDPDADALIVDTPGDQARKDYIGNAANDGRLATVFAQLEVAGEGYGVHAVLVPIRDESGQPVPGVTITDCGEKVGLNAVDNGRLRFDHVRVPRANLLDRFGRIEAPDEAGEGYPHGRYVSDIPSPSRRFFTMLGTLVGGRIAVGSAAVSASKVALAIAVRYGERRRQFGREGEPEVRILDYRTHQRRLMPRLARAYALNAALHDLAERYAATGHDDAEARRAIEVEAAGLKAYSTWANLETIQICRECCGGVGYLAENRFGQLRRDCDIYTTFEGDNVVLMQLVARGLLSDLKREFSGMGWLGMVRFAAAQATTAIADRNPVITRKTDEAHLRDPKVLAELLRARERELLTDAAQRFKAKVDETRDSFAALVYTQDHLVTLADAHVERVVVERFRSVADGCDDPALRSMLTDLCDLFALWRIEQQRGWFLEEGYLEGRKAKAIRALVNQLCETVREQAMPLVDAFGIPPETLGAPIATFD